MKYNINKSKQKLIPKGQKGLSAEPQYKDYGYTDEMRQKALKKQQDRNNDYLNNPFNLEQLKNRTKELLQIFKPMAIAGAGATAAITVPASLGPIASATSVAARGAIQGAGIGMLPGMSTGSAATDALSGVGGEMVGPVAVKAAPLVKKGLQKAIPKIPGTTPKPLLASYIPDYASYKQSPQEAFMNLMEGSDDANWFIHSETVNNTLQRNNRLADRLGIKNNPEPYKQKPFLSHKIVDNFNNVNGTSNSPSDNLDKTRGIFNRVNNEIIIKKPVNSDTSFHEHLHSYGYGSRPIQHFKAKYLFDPEKIKNLNDKSKNYYLSGTEAAVQYAQLGYNYELDVGQKYPGWESVRDLLSNGMYGSPIFSKLNTPRDYKRVWDAMTGKYFIIPAAIGTQYNESE